ncbi:MAG: dihydropteroate synthase, partial [Sneathiella sp.]|nr:dihydropteroate synthase [Sneathiella sp.]
MVLINKGSALPRGLSLSDKVYLAPSKVMGEISFFTVAIRNGSIVSHFADHPVSEIREWCSGLEIQRTTIQRQVEFIEGKKSRAVLGATGSPLIMGIVNVTPDSFSDGGEFATEDAAVKHAIALAAEGADILDFGGESTRPGANVICVADETNRVVPVIKRCVDLGPWLSIDTRKSDVMTAATAAGANLINDVTAFEYDTE